MKIVLDALGFEHGFKAGVHFFFFDKLAALGRGDAFLHGGKEAGFFVEITGNFRHQALGDGPGFSGDLRKLRLLTPAESRRGELKFAAAR